MPGALQRRLRLGFSPARTITLTKLYGRSHRLHRVAGLLPCLLGRHSIVDQVLLNVLPDERRETTAILVATLRLIDRGDGLDVNVGQLVFVDTLRDVIVQEYQKEVSAVTASQSA